MGKILAVDDNQELLLALQLELEEVSTYFDSCTDPKKIPEKFAQQHYDLVLLDLNFSPGNTDGQEGFDWIPVIKK